MPRLVTVSRILLLTIGLSCAVVVYYGMQTLGDQIRENDVQIALLRKRLSISSAPEQCPTPTAYTASATPAAIITAVPSLPKRAASQTVVRWRIAAIEKFIPLDSDQRAALTELFAGRSDKISLESILGSENADYLSQQRRQAFERAKAEDQERELYFMSRRFTLDQNQEQAVAAALSAIEKEISESMHAKQQSLIESGDHSPASRMQLMIEEQQLRETLMQERLQPIMSLDQFNKFLEYQRSSASRDLELWHSAE